jgi:nitroreductase
VVILIAGDKRAIGGPQINIGICGENMNLVALSLGLGACWIGFSQLINMMPQWRERFALGPNWDICTAMVLGYPRFKQQGIVPREFRPVAWFREGSETAVMQE